MEPSRTCVLIDQISLNLWLTKKLILLIQSYDDRYRGRKRKQSCKIYYTLASRSVYIARIKSIKRIKVTCQGPASQFNQELKQNHYKIFIKYPFLYFITQSPDPKSSETNTGNIFLRHNLAVSSTARYRLAGNILDEVRAKKNRFGPLSHKIIPGNSSLLKNKFLHTFGRFSTRWLRRKRFRKKTLSETISCYRKFIKQQAWRARPFG